MKKLPLVIAATLLVSPAVNAQCADCGAEKNKTDREKSKEQEKRNSDDKVREKMGDGTLRDAAEKAKDHNDKNQKALDSVDDPN